MKLISALGCRWLVITDHFFHRLVGAVLRFLLIAASCIEFHLTSDIQIYLQIYCKLTNIFTLAQTIGFDAGNQTMGYDDKNDSGIDLFTIRQCSVYSDLSSISHLSILQPSRLLLAGFVKPSACKRTVKAVVLIGARGVGPGPPGIRQSVKFNAFGNTRLVGELRFDFFLCFYACIWANSVRGRQEPPDIFIARRPWLARPSRIQCDVIGPT